MRDPLPIYIGWDDREPQGFRVAADSIRRHASVPVAIEALNARDLYERRLLWRPVEQHGGQMIDHLSGAPQSTQFASARFLVPILSPGRWSLFIDSDFLFLADVAELFALADDRYAVMCVQHPPMATTGTKMDGQVQTSYPRKLWSSCVLWNGSHAAHLRMSLSMINHYPGELLHRFCWIRDSEIGALPPEWNVLIGLQDMPPDPKALHYTLGTIETLGHANGPHAELWTTARDGLLNEGVNA